MATGGRLMAQLTRETQGYVQTRKIITEMMGKEFDEQTLLDSLEGETDFAEAVMAIYEEIEQATIQLKGLKAHLDELGQRKGRMEKTIETYRNLILIAMERAEVQQVKSPICTISISRSKSAPFISDESKIPTKYWNRGDPKLDKRRLMAEAKEGKEIDGVEWDNGSIGLTIGRK
jgi:hypothetical protein